LGARAGSADPEVQTTTGRDAISPCRTRAAASNSPDQLGAYITLQPRNTADRGPLAPRRSTVEAHERQRDRHDDSGRTIPFVANQQSHARAKQQRDVCRRIVPAIQPSRRTRRDS
jgi:hypothetical protein